MSAKISRYKKRTYGELKEHYEVEKELAERLRNSTKEERRELYSSVYDKLFERVPQHPQLTRKVNAKATTVAVARQMRLLRNYLRPELTFLEVGPGDCSLSFEVAKYVRSVYAVDVSAKITKRLTYPKNFELIMSDGCGIPVPQQSINIAYSNQLMEHLHPDDAFEQLQNVYKALAPGGLYICITPNRLSGPHDISKYFDEVATGFHLKEYTFSELNNLFRKVGFSKTLAYMSGKGIYIKCPIFLIKVSEKIVGMLPFPLRRRISRSLPLKALLGRIILVAVK